MLISRDISSKDEGFNIHVLPHMFHTIPFAYSPSTFITQLASSRFFMCKKHCFVYSKKFILCISLQPCLTNNFLFFWHSKTPFLFVALIRVTFPVYLMYLSLIFFSSHQNLLIGELISSNMVVNSLKQQIPWLGIVCAIALTRISLTTIDKNCLFTLVIFSKPFLWSP